MNRTIPSLASLACLLLLASCTYPLDVTVSITPPSSQSITISGPLTVREVSPIAAFSITFQGNPDTYQWYMDGTAISGATTSTLSVDVTNPALSIGMHWLSIVILDTSGIRYSGSAGFQVAN